LVRRHLLGVRRQREEAGEEFHRPQQQQERGRVAREILAQRDKGMLTLEKPTVGTLLDSVLDDYKINGKDYAWAKRVIERHIRPAFGHLDAPKVDTPALRRYIAQRQEAGASNATINHALALLRRAFNLAAKSTPPTVMRVPYFPMLKVSNSRKGFFEHPQYQAMFEALPEDLRPVLAFAYFTGCRRAEIMALEWPQLDFAERLVRLEPGTTKNDEARTIPLAGPLYQLLVMQKSIRDRYHPRCPWVFFRHASGEPIRNFRKAWDSACQKAGLWAGDEKTGKPTKLFHDLRRTAVRNLVRAGTPEIVAMQVSGHKTRSVFDRYNIVSERDLKDAARRLGDYLAQPCEPQPQEGSTVPDHDSALLQ
jgi:integrase